jgi:hypothetical protein
MAHLQGRLKSDLDEKDGVIQTSTETAHESTLEIDLTKYHEQRAGSLVLDPKCVCFLSFRWYALPIAPTQQ